MSTSWLVRRPSVLQGTAALPGDKSISHRALLLHALAAGEGRLRGLNAGADVAATRRALAALGCSIREVDGEVRIHGRGGRLRPASAAIDCANSGTTMRLLAGIVAAQPFTTTLDGDASLRRRPMERIAAPLRAMGARVEGPDGGRTAPLIVTGGPLRGGSFPLPIASAQVKSCILLAAAAAGVQVEVIEPVPTRDHTERMLRAMGADVECAGERVRLRGGAPLRALSLEVPGDPSAAALLAAAVLAVPGSQVRLQGVGVNPGRAAFLTVLQRMGAVIHLQGVREAAGEPVADVTIESGPPLRALEVTPVEVPALVDEIPALAVVCALAQGTSCLRGLGELRLKESDRVAGLAALLRRFSIDAREDGDDLLVRGGTPTAPARVDAGDDHRLVMAAAALALAALARADAGVAGCAVSDIAAAAVSFPGFVAALEGLQGRRAAPAADGSAGGEPS